MKAVPDTKTFTVSECRVKKKHKPDKQGVVRQANERALNGKISKN